MSMRLRTQKTREDLAVQNLEAGLQVTDLPVWHRCIVHFKWCMHPHELHAVSLLVPGYCTVHSDNQNTLRGAAKCYRLQGH